MVTMDATGTPTLKRYAVLVRNEGTQERTVVRCESSCKEQAMTDALHKLFRQTDGVWRHMTALVARRTDAAPPGPKPRAPRHDFAEHFWAGGSIPINPLRIRRAY